MIRLNLPSGPVSDRISIHRPCKPNECFTIADLDGCGCIRHIWICPWRKRTPQQNIILRIYFDKNPIPYVEAPLGDFFGIMHGEAFYPINTEYITTLEESAYNCYFPMPFSNGARVELEIGEQECSVFLMIDWHYFPGQTMPEPARFCARWRHESPTERYGKDFLVLDADGPGQLLGFTYGVRLHDNMDRWSHGGADNIYIDGEEEYPAFLRGIGGEDTFGTSYGGALHRPETKLYTGLPYYIHADIGEARPAQRLTGYRFFIKDSIHFKKSIQFRFGSMENEIFSTVYWYSQKPVREYYKLPAANLLRLDSLTLGQDVPLPGNGDWYLCGPFPRQNTLPLESLNEDILNHRFDKTYPINSEHTYGKDAKSEAFWIEASAVHGFVDFRHFFRVRKRGVSPTEDGLAIAVCSLDVPDDTDAVLSISWDDELTLICNKQTMELGRHTAFRTRTVQVKLYKGRNTILLTLSNTIGHNHGGWAFAFKAHTSDGVEVFPALF